LLGVVSTLAGSTQGYTDGTGAAAQFSSPRGVAVDASGNVYVADWSNHRIRKVTPTGVVTTLAGSTNGYADGPGAAAQFFNPSGVAVDASGNVYVADTNNQRIRKVTPTGVVTTVAGSTRGYADDTGTAAQFFNPTGVAFDASGNVYVADSWNFRIRKIH
jgi:sugar lactone lactonase YvrE